MPKSSFRYVVYIASTPERVWTALLDGEIARRYWGHENVSDWKPGSTWEHRRTDAGRTLDLVREVLESEPPRRLVITWAEPADRARRDAVAAGTGYLPPVATMVRLTVTHDELVGGQLADTGAGGGWAWVLSDLKSLLETGEPLGAW